MIPRSVCLLLLVLTLNVLPVFGDEDPVVLSLDGIEVSLNEFEHRFGIIMVIQAIQSGTPIKDQNRIQVLREQFLEQRATELVLLQEVKRRNLLFTDEQLATKVAEYVETMGWEDNLEGNLEMVGFRDKSELSELIQERQLIQLLITDLENHFTGLGLVGAELRQAIQQQIGQFRNEYNLVVYPSG